MTQNIVTNIIKIRHKKEIRQSVIASAIGIDSSTYSKIESGQVALSIDRLSAIADFFGMSVIDVITYPAKYINSEESPQKEHNNKKPKMLVQFEVDDEKRDEVLRVIFNN